MTSALVNGPADPTILDVPVDILCSYHYFNDIDMAKIKSWGARIIGDSGAFSAMSSGKPIDREEFHAWAARWQDALFWIAALDEIGDAKASHQNWEAARRDGLELVPTIHYGEGTAQLDRFAEEGATLIGLGGMVPYSSEKDRLMRWCLLMHRHARDHHPQVRFHGWGVTHRLLLDNLPWWSTDSSGFSSCFRFGSLRLWIPERANFVSVNLNGRDLAKYAKLLRDVYGADWKEVSRSTPANRRPLGRVALRAVQLYAKWLQKRQQVSAPALLKSRLTGPLQVGAPGADTPAVYCNPNGKEIPRSDGAPYLVSAMSVTGNASTRTLLDPDTGVRGPTVATARNESWNALNPSGEQSLRNASAASGPLQVGAFGLGKDSALIHPIAGRWPVYSHGETDTCVTGPL